MKKPIELVKVKNKKIGELRHDSVDARELHSFLESKQQFADWIKNKIEKYGFVENEDYISLHKSMKRDNGATHLVDYTITLDMAKELGMLEANQKGKQIRKYFIEVEKYALALAEKRELELKERLKNKEEIEFYQKKHKETKNAVEDLKNEIYFKYLNTFVEVHKLFNLSDLYSNISKAFVAAIENPSKKEMLKILNTRQEELLIEILRNFEAILEKSPELKELLEDAEYYIKFEKQHLKLQKG